MMRDNGFPPVFGVVPAAGMSRRMGTAKQTLAVGEYTMTGRVVRTMLDAGLRDVVLVTRSELVPALELPENDRLLIAINDDSNTQMLDSIRIGLARLNSEGVFTSIDSANAGVLVIPGDMPTVPLAACEACVDAFGQDPTRIVIAACGKKRGHPILFPLNMRESLQELTGGLNGLPVRFVGRVLHVEYNDPAVLRDVDTRSDYRELCD